jgi:DNA-binding winged helix-turn-helix (wHTH) protein
VLAYLVEHASELVTKEALTEAIWPATVVSDAVLKAHIRNVRQSLGDTRYRRPSLSRLWRSLSSLGGFPYAMRVAAPG